MTKFDVTVVDYPAKHLVGMKVRSTMAKAHVDCPAIWQTFGPKMGLGCEAGSAPVGSFGVCVMVNAEEFDYWAAAQANASAAVPAGMGAIDLPAGLYAKAVLPNLENLGDAYTFLYTEWPKEQTDYICDETVPCFEWYPPDWQPNSALEVFMAVKKR